MSSNNHRRQDRRKAVFPVKVRGKDAAGETFEDMAHTLDVTPTGVRLGSIRRELQVLDPVTIWYRKRKMEFRVVWIKKLKGSAEYQIGLQALALEKEVWGLNPSDFPVHQEKPAAATASA
ncbi:MAG TPA: hypothetical protein VKR60_08320 [Candidatus Sulfotelmatobacter sp.]|nr:hypothetical protein [Candidatus Sulfotelmatobacter sp.]